MERSLKASGVIRRPRSLWLALCGFTHFFLGASAHATGGTPDAVPIHRRTAELEGKPWVKRVLLVHGIYNPFMGNIGRALKSRGWEVYAAHLKPSNATVGFDAMAKQVAQFVDANIPPGAKFDLVGFSMGGLVCRYYVQKMGGASRVRRFVTLSAPNHGTVWAYLSGRTGVKQMRPGSEMLNDLNAHAAMLAPLDYTSIYTPLDLTIFPAISSRMDVARNVVTWVPLHPLMVWMAAPLRAVERALE